jgi:nitroreductase
MRSCLSPQRVQLAAVRELDVIEIPAGPDAGGVEFTGRGLGVDEGFVPAILSYSPARMRGYSGRIMSQPADLAEAVERALRAPSVHNTQPWLWRIRPGVVELHADWTRHLTATDPDRRDVLLSCGAALHHLQVALAARNVAVHVDRLPDPEAYGHLATVMIRPGAGDAHDAALFPSIDRRRTDRRRMSHRPVPSSHIRTLVEQASRVGAVLIPVTGPALRQRLSAALTAAAATQAGAPGYLAELQLWTRRHAGGRDGIPASNVPPPPVGLIEPSLLRQFPSGRLSQPSQPAGHAPPDDAAEFLVIATQADEQLDRLRAGEATSAVLLTATQLGLATTPLSQALEVDVTGQDLRQQVLHIPEYPQLIIRIGWPVTGTAEPPLTPRRDLRSILLPSP